MDDKGTEEELTYPNIYFTVDNFEEVINAHSKVQMHALLFRDKKCF